jgi:type IV pilus biogenesis protein PilP
MAKFKRAFILCALTTVNAALFTGASASVFSVPDCNLVANVAQRLTCIAADKAVATNQYGLDKALQSIASLSAKKHGVRKLGMPNVASTYGIGKDLTAVLSWKNGNSLTVKNGDLLPDGWRVTNISTGLVTLSRNGTHHILLMRGASADSDRSKAVPRFAGRFMPPHFIPPVK